MTFDFDKRHSSSFSVKCAIKRDKMGKTDKKLKKDTNHLNRGKQVRYFVFFSFLKCDHLSVKKKIWYPIESIIRFVFVSVSYAIGEA